MDILSQRGFKNSAVPLITDRLAFGLVLRRPWLGLLAIVVLFSCSSCSTNKPNRLALMQPPAVFEGGQVNPFSGTPEEKKSMSFDIFYATDRQPVEPKEQRYSYLDKRGDSLRVGAATISFVDENGDWDELLQETIIEGHSGGWHAEVADVSEIGALSSSLSFLDPVSGTEEALLPDAHFAAAINNELGQSKKKDIYIYVHGIRVNFENPLLIGGELWHYMGREGVFLAYAWPSTTNAWLAYFADIETAASTTRNFRLLLSFLAAETDVERIHILCYSAGSRVVADALNELRLVYYSDDETALRHKLKIGKVIFVGPDISLDVFRSHYRDRLFDLPEQIIIYLSRKDNVLKWARFFFREERLGDNLGFTDSELEYLSSVEKTVVIDVTDAEQAITENGHRYFRKSPWVTSDILMTLKFGLQPAERGLVREEGEAMWCFPPDYVERLRKAVAPLYEELDAD